MTTSGGRTVAHVFNPATHENYERVVRKCLHQSLSSGLVLAGGNAWSEFISFDWQRTNQNMAGKGERIYGLRCGWEVKTGCPNFAGFVAIVDHLRMTVGNI